MEEDEDNENVLMTEPDESVKKKFDKCQTITELEKCWKGLSKDEKANNILRKYVADLKANMQNEETLKQ